MHPKDKGRSRPLFTFRLNIIDPNVMLHVAASVMSRFEFDPATFPHELVPTGWDTTKFDPASIIGVKGTNM